jgi:hypothetical protein
MNNKLLEQLKSIANRIMELETSQHDRYGQKEAVLQDLRAEFARLLMS